MATKLKNLSVTKVALVDAGANPDADILIYKAEVPPDHKEATPVADEIVAKSDHDAVVAELESAKAELAALAEITNEDLAALRGFEIAKAEEQDDDVLKGLPEAVRKRLEDAEATIAKMQAEQRADTFVKKAAEFPHIAGAAELGPVLEEIDRVAPEAAKAIEQYLKAANARLDESGLFTELGTDAETGDDTIAKANALIAQAMEGGLSRPDAIKKVFSEHPDLVVPAKSA